MVTVFLSYSRDDAEIVSVLAEDIRSLGHAAWLDRELTGGQRWWDHILEEIRDCDAFVTSVSTSAIDSRACRSEYEYAVALGKPILPVIVQGGVADSLMPPELAALHRVDYTTNDKGSFAALNRALSTLPAAPPLPDPLPPQPAVPASYLFDLRSEIESTEPLTSERQLQLVQQLRGRLEEGHARPDILSLVQRLRKRDDLLVRVDQELGELQRELEQSPATTAATTPLAATPATPVAAVTPATPATPVPEEAMTFAAAAPAPALASAPSAPGVVSVWWWIAPIIFGLIGGLVAFFATRDANPSMAKNMLIVGVIMSVFWYLFAAGA